MSDHILYNHGDIDTAHDHISQGFGGVDGVKQDIGKLFGLLSSVYDGEAATAMAAKGQQVLGSLDEALQDAATLTRQAREQNEAMRALDIHNAHQF
jgi:hypothetical protein